jgi:hypothetical protein
MRVNEKTDLFDCKCLSKRVTLKTKGIGQNLPGGISSRDRVDFTKEGVVVEGEAIV